MEAFKEMAPAGFQFNVIDRGPEMLKVGVFGGKMDMAVFAGKGGAPVWKHMLTFDQVVMFKRALEKVLASQAGFKHPLVVQQWNRDEKKFEVRGTIIIGKNDKQVVFIEIQFNANGNHKSLLFEMRAAASLSSGVDPMSDGDKSVVRANALLWWIDHYLPTAMLLSARKFKPQGGGGGYGGGGGGNSGGGGGGGGSYGGDSNPNF